MLVRIIKNWTTPDIMRQTPGGDGAWDGIRFTCDPNGECDAAIILNHAIEPASVHCSPDNVWALMQEPYLPDAFSWMAKGHERYAQVFTHHPSDEREPKYVRSQPAVPWHVNKTYDELKNIGVPEKCKDLSWITSNLMGFPGHRLRMDFLAHLKTHAFPMDVYGKGIRYIEDKWDGLAPYRYSLAVENSSGPDYWTEKVADCFLSWTVPIYYGCTNLEDYFPPGSFVRIDISRPDDAMQIIRATVSSGDWAARQGAVAEARKLVLEKYQFFPHVHSLIMRHHKATPKRPLVLQPWRQRRTLAQRAYGRLSRMLAGA